MGVFDLRGGCRKFVAEAVGAFTLVFVGAGTIMATGGTDIVAVALAHGLAIALMISVFGHVSGGFFNPAITIGFWATRRLGTVQTASYIIAQLVGAVVAAAALWLFFPEVLREAQNLGTPALTGDVEFIKGVGLEAIATALLMLAVISALRDPPGLGVGGLFVGIVVAIDVFAISRLTGAAMNPARAFGPALIDNTWDDHLIYWIGPIIGAVAAALLHRYFFAVKDEHEITDVAI